MAGEAGTREKATAGKATGVSGLIFTVLALVNYYTRDLHGSALMPQKTKRETVFNSPKALFGLVQKFTLSSIVP